MTAIATGVLAAKKQTWRQKTVRDLLVEVLDAHPKADDVELRRHFREAARDDADYFAAVCDYAYDNAMRAKEQQQRQGRTPAEVKVAAESQRQEQDKLVQYIKEQIILLNQEMPNGKRTRYCTLDYMYRLGGAYRSVGKKGSQKLVGSVYSEDQYRAKLRGLA